MASDEDKWVLHYWPGFAGRGEFVRIVFEEVGEPYVNNHDQCKDYFYGGKARFGEADFFPSFAPPLLQKGNFSLSSTPVVCKYLATKFGLIPDNEEDRWHAEQVNNAIHDYLAEGCLSFHGIDPVASHSVQEEATKPYIKRFVAERFPKWLKHFEAVLKANKGGKGFLFGDKLTYVDLALLHVLRVTAFQFPEAWKEASGDYAKLLADFKDRLSARPKLAAYFASDRCTPFSGGRLLDRPIHFKLLKMSNSELWILHYWPMAGRGEFVRIIFEEVGVPYENNSEHVMEWTHGGKARFGNAGFFPTFAVPMIQKGDFYLSSTAVICKYLGNKFGLVPEKEDDRWHAEQVNGAVHDYLLEGNLSFHGINPVASYADQKEATQPYIKRFLEDRFPKWLRHFEAVLRANNGGKGFLIGDKLTYVDLALLHVLRVTASQFPKEWKEASEDYATLLSAYKDRLSARPKLAAYFASDRCRPFEGVSMM